jgi:4-coumarate--CoA ligase
VSNCIFIHTSQQKDHAKVDDVVLSPLPLYHIYAFTCSLHAPLLSGNTLVTMKRFDMNACCALIEKYKCTHLHVVPPVVLALAKSPDLHKYDLSSLRVAMSAAAPLASEQEKEFSENLDCMIKQGERSLGCLVVALCVVGLIS